ncbi:MAG: hypothetical protein V4671_25630 [Armatimonadota bacterium]
MSTITGLLGLDTPTNPFQSQIDGSANKIRKTGDLYSDFGQGAKSEFDWLSPLFKQSLQKRMSSLSDDPFTDSYSTAQLGRATQGTTAAYNAARSSLNSDLSERGISPDSSAAIGGLTSIENQRQSIMGNAQNGLAMQRIESRDEDEDELMRLLGGVRASAKGDFFGSLAGQGGIEQFIAQLYAGTGAQQMNAKAQQSGNFMDLIQTAASAGAF